MWCVVLCGVLCVCVVCLLGVFTGNKEGLRAAPTFSRRLNNEGGGFGTGKIPEYR